MVMADLGDDIAVGLIVDLETVDAELARHDFPRQNQIRTKGSPGDPNGNCERSPPHSKFTGASNPTNFAEPCQGPHSR